MNEKSGCPAPCAFCKGRVQDRPQRRAAHPQDWRLAQPSALFAEARDVLRPPWRPDNTASFDEEISLSRFLNRELQSYGLGHGHQRREPRVSPTRQSAIQTLAFNSRRFGYLRNAAAGLRNATQGDQEHAWLVVILQRRPEILGGELWIVVQFTNRRLIVRYARLTFHRHEPAKLKVPPLRRIARYRERSRSGRDDRVWGSGYSCRNLFFLDSDRQHRYDMESAVSYLRMAARRSLCETLTRRCTPRTPSVPETGTQCAICNA